MHICCEDKRCLPLVEEKPAARWSLAVKDLRERKVRVRTREDALSAAEKQKTKRFGFGCLQTGSASAPETAGAELHLCPAPTGAFLER